jgi:hypothetical protein
MLLLKPDPTFYPSAKLAMQALQRAWPTLRQCSNGKPDAR